MRILLAATAVALTAALTAPVASALPDVQPAGTVTAPPDGPAPSWLVADLDSGKILGSRDPTGVHAPASTIKPLLAMVVLDHLNPNAVARANVSHTQVECSCVGLVPGQAYTTTQLLAGLLMVSGNDAANMLADMLGGQQVAVAAMNAKAQALGARSTHASSPSGLDGPGWETLTTPYDLALIYRQALKYPLIAKIFQSPTASFPGKDGTPKTLTAQNELLARYPGDFAGKTGYTDLARKTFVTAAARNGRRLLVVLMYGSGDLYGQATDLFDWGFAQPA
ncbi:D-alanyl-D-alanine carboxypeptidase [Mycolicibacterium madagascariense]|uniref:D-alanyl-D-alanine carboxypeptidase n=1 Tax=Mycolicibacterium madagascariense TaxID=212765 RepID=A0A7I7XF83_9MYCO|nr:serine hydrolase [Mycolicibacterium madagascariense]MCV7015584.1 D-alanyl-D-alanine carboxypeptidase [Mycolicibacterium madagascariense]BBZ27845.1 D-alanyl-D-alanine carboxypeptidase [Mycolicibacterium madagascariense]